MNIHSIGVIGAGAMGSGIAQNLAVSGYQVILSDVGERQLELGIKSLSSSLDRLIKKEKLSGEDKDAALSRIATTTDMMAMKSCDLIVEAATENLELKLQIFGQIDAIAQPEAIIATNTSSISITKLAAATKRPGQVIGMHFFNPVPLMALVELIRGLDTSDATFAAVEEFTRRLGKTPVQVRNSPGFVVNRMLCPMINEAIFALGEGLATASEIDDAMKLGANHPIGPLALCDLIGLDVQLAVMQVLFEGFKDPKYRPAPLLVEMVEAGRLGRKTKRGFFEY